MSPKTLTNFRLDGEMIAALQRIRDRDLKPVSEQVREALRDWIRKNGESLTLTTPPKKKRRK